MADVLIDGSPVRVMESAPGIEKDLEAPASVVHEYLAARPGRHVPQMVIATTVVAVLPLVVSLGLRASGLVSGWVSVGLAVVMSLAASTAGSAYWRRHGGEVLFGELLLWGWIRSWRQERELANATRLLHLVSPTAASSVVPDELSVEEREHLLRQLAGALEGQDVYLNGHSHRVARHATMIARGMGLSSEEVARVRAAAAVHDVGKLRTPKSILNKPGRLTDAEFEVIKRHPVDGAQMVAALGDPELTRIVRHHHERLDGAGYPDRLKGEDIPVGARIIAVADTFDAITSARPYREAAPHQKAIDILRKEAGTQLDPDAVRAFLAYYSGSRPTIVWAIVTSSLRRVIAWLSGDPAAAASLSASKVAAATAATAAIGAAAGAAPVPVVQHAARPVHAHAIAVRPRTPRTGLRQHGALVSATVPAASAAAAGAHKPAPAKSHRVTAHTAAAPRRDARPVHSGGRTNHPALSTGGSSAPAASTLTRRASVSGSSPANPSTSHPSPSSGGNSSVSSTGNPAPTPAAPATQSQGSSANGNAYGHTKVLGNGHGKGQAKGHDNTSPAPSSVQPPSAPVTVSVPNDGNSQSGTHGQGNNGDSSHGNGNANGHDNSQGNGNSQSNGHGQGNASASAVATPSPSNPISNPDDSGRDAGASGNNGNNGNGSSNGDNGNGGGQGHGNGHGHG